MIKGLPGEEMIEQGVRDLWAQRETIASLLVAIGAPRLRRLGIDLPELSQQNPEHRLYDLLAQDDADSAHSRYNALIRRLVSFERAAECVKVTAPRLEQFMKALGAAVKNKAQVYLVGGATSVLLGWRDSTIDVDLKVIPEADDFFRSLPALKERLQMNIELASPDLFIPELPGWQERSRFIKKEGTLEFFHYDFYAQTLAKIERGHQTDLQDVREMISGGMVNPHRLLELFNEIEDQIYRYPALDHASFRRSVESVVSGSEASEETKDEQT